MSALGRQFDPELHQMVENYRNKHTGLPGGFAAPQGEKVLAEHIYSQLDADAKSYDPHSGRVFLRNHEDPSRHSQEGWNDYLGMLHRHISGPDRAHLTEPPQTVRSDFGPRLESAAVDHLGRRIPIHVYPAPGR